MRVQGRWTKISRLTLMGVSKKLLCFWGTLDRIPVCMPISEILALAILSHSSFCKIVLEWWHALNLRILMFSPRHKFLTNSIISSHLRVFIRLNNKKSKFLKEKHRIWNFDNWVFDIFFEQGIGGVPMNKMKGFVASITFLVTRSFFRTTIPETSFFRKKGVE